MCLRGCPCEHVCPCVGILLVWCACARMCTCACMRVAKGVLTYRCIRARICVRCVDVCIYAGACVVHACGHSQGAMYYSATSNDAAS